MTRSLLCRNCLFVALALAFSTVSSSAHANSDLCSSYGISPADDQGYEIACGNGEGYFADLEVTPTSDDGGDIVIHITDHFACDGGTHMECALSTNRTHACMPEGEYNSSYTGAVPFLLLECGCYSDDDPCESTVDGSSD
jgi:hypothetical protein